MAKRVSRKQVTIRKAAKARPAKAAKAAGGRARRTAKVSRGNKAPARKRTAPPGGASTKAAKRTTRARRTAAGTATRTAPASKRSVLGSVATAVRGTVAGAISAVRRTVSGHSDAITLLEADHRRMQELLKRGEETTARGGQVRRDLLDALTADLAVHELLEERVLYPALQARPEAKDLALEGFQEHHVADVLVKELHEVATDDEQWGAKLTVLRETLEHHIGEEEGEMFRTARALFSQNELEEMGEQMTTIKAQEQRS